MQPWRTEFRCQRMLLSSWGAMQRLVSRGKLHRVPFMELRTSDCRVINEHLQPGKAAVLRLQLWAPAGLTQQGCSNKALDTGTVILFMIFFPLWNGTQNLLLCLPPFMDCWLPSLEDEMRTIPTQDLSNSGIRGDLPGLVSIAHFQPEWMMFICWRSNILE